MLFNKHPGHVKLSSIIKCLWLFQKKSYGSFLHVLSTKVQQSYWSSWRKPELKKKITLQNKYDLALVFLIKLAEFPTGKSQSCSWPVSLTV